MGHEKKILIVDDSPVVIRLVKGILEENGYTSVENVSCADDAILAIEKQLPDLVLLDYQMPNKTGEYVLDFVKDKHADTIVIMLSGQQERDTVVRLMRKADNYIIKDNLSQVKDELTKAIGHCFDMQRLKEENKMLMRTLKERNDILEKQLAIARTLLKGIFPAKVEQSSFYDIEIYNNTWDIIGGDFYNITRLDAKRIALFLGDICGHGIEAALLLFTLSNVYKGVLQNFTTGHGLLREMSGLIRNQFPKGSFVTCSFIMLDEEKQDVLITTASDTPILYQAQDGSIMEIRTGEISNLGLVDIDHSAHKDRNFLSETRITLGEGEKIFMFTDGITEARNEKRELFELENVKKVISETRGKGINETIKNLSKSVKDYTKNKITDDVTIIGISKKA
jgi:sigma-B regulation protein RsbU (phosphoserine phosphatase)